MYKDCYVLSAIIQINQVLIANTSKSEVYLWMPQYIEYISQKQTSKKFQ